MGTEHVVRSLHLLYCSTLCWPLAPNLRAKAGSAGRQALVNAAVVADAEV